MQQELQSIPVQTQDGQILEVDWNLMRFHSKFFNELEFEHDASKPLKLEISQKIFSKIYTYLIDHGFIGFPTIPKPIPSNHLETFLPLKDVQLVQQIEESDYKAFDQAAQYLQIPYIIDLLRAQIASYFFGKTMAEIQQEFEISEPYNQETEEQIKKDYAQFLQGCNMQGDQVQ